MGQVAIQLNGRIYRFVCGDGDEPRITALADYIRSKLNQLGQETTRAGDDRMLVMAALMLADELFDARAATQAASVSAQTPLPRKSQERVT
jgi:cell division protein ZapA